MIKQREKHIDNANQGGFLPTAEQQLLITIVLGNQDEAVQAWNTWKASVDFNMIDHGSRRLIPLVYKKLRILGVEDKLTGKCRGIYRAYWYRNNLLIHQAVAIIRKLTDAGIPVMLHKGIALCSSYYKEIGLRPLNDVDLLVRTDDVLRAAQIISDLGFQSVPPRFKEIHEGLLYIKHSRNFVDQKGMDIDLNWHALKECCSPHDDDDFWRDSVPSELDGMQLRILNPADLFLTILIHGLKWDPVPPFRWIIDANTILEHHKNNFDWNRILMQVEKLRLCLRLKNAVRVLRDTARVEIPDDVARRIDRLPVAQFERAEYKYMSEPQNFKLLPYTAPLWYNAYRLKKTSNPFLILRRFIHDAFVTWNWKWDVIPVLTFEKCIKFVRIIQNL
ncbi:MAG: nucleotidyltransferase family protein [Bacteroidota bacterium]